MMFGAAKNNRKALLMENIFRSGAGWDGKSCGTVQTHTLSPPWCDERTSSLPLLALLEHRQKHASLIKPIFFRRLAVSLSDFLPMRHHTRSRHMWIINHKISSKTFMSSGFFLAYTHTYIIILYPSPLRIINYVIFPGNERSGKLIVPPSEIGKKVYCLAYRGGWVAGNGGKFSSSDCQQTVNRLSTFFLLYLSARSFSSFLFN